MRRTTPKFGWLFMQTIAIANLEPVLLNKLKSIENTVIEFRESAIYKIYPRTNFGHHNRLITKV